MKKEPQLILRLRFGTRSRGGIFKSEWFESESYVILLSV